MQRGEDICFCVKNIFLSLFLILHVLFLFIFLFYFLYLQLYFIWVTGSQRHFEWLLDIIREVEEVDQKGIVSIDIFITQFFQNFDLRTCMLVRICLHNFV